MQDAIVALATAPGRAAIGVIRLSGPQLQPVIDAVVGVRLQPRQARYGPFLDAGGQAIDHGLALHFPAPHSYTGEQVLELQAHGGPVVLHRLLARCLQAGAAIGLRLADPGEFTQRAFINGKLDLAQAEGVADLIDASTEAAARSAVRALAGTFSRASDDLATRIVKLRLLIEATLDFPDEGMDFLQQADAQGQLFAIRCAVQALLTGARQGALLRDGLRVVLAGQPNAGKSSLLNALAGHEAAIVSPLPGTTRDRITETLQIEGVPIHIVDTAGLRGEQQADEIERLGMARTWEAVRTADLTLLLRDLSLVGDAVAELRDAELAAQLPAPVLSVYSKGDLLPAQQWPADALVVSALTGQGLDALRQRLLEVAGWQPTQEGVTLARARHLDALRRADAALQQAAADLANGERTLELAAEHLRHAHEALQAITGAQTADDLLGEIFSRFCIGK